MPVTQATLPHAQQTGARHDEHPALELSDVTRRFPNGLGVRSACLSIVPGELFGLLGPSGSGKTTLLRLIAGLDRPDSGTVSLAGQIVAGDGRWVEPEHRGIGLVPQGDALFPHLTVGENVLFGVRGRPELALRALELVGLADRADSRPGELSGGERQRVALARALAPQPSVVLLDEPFSALDSALRGRLRRDVVSVLRKAGATGVLVTHDQEEALGLCDRVAVVRSGEIIQCGHPTELYWRPVDTWTARFLGEVNVMTAEVHVDGAHTALGRIPTPLCLDRRGSCQVGVRPEHLVIEVDDQAEAVITAREFRGHDVLYEVGHPVAGTIVIQLPSLELFDPGQRVRVRPHERAAAAVLDHA